MPSADHPGGPGERGRLEEELLAARRRFQVLFERNPQPISISRLSDGRFVDANEAYLKLTGFSRLEIVGRARAELGIWPPDRWEQLASALRENGSLQRVEVPCRTKDGRVRLLEASAEPIDFDGEACALVASTDITERRAAEDALRESEAAARARADELAAVLDATPAALWIAHDRDCRQVQSSRKGFELLRIRVGGEVSKTAAQDAPAHFRILQDGVELPNDQLPLQRAAREGIELRGFEEEIRFDDGSSVFVYGSAVPLRAPDGSPRGAIATFIDITALKQAEAALRDADQRKDEFIAVLSHELRNPLAPILTAVQLMKLRGDVATAHERDVIERQATHALRLIEDLLDVSRIARGKIELRRRRLELGTIVAQAIESTSQLFEQKQQHLAPQVPAVGLTVEGDEGRLVQVVANLLTNASRYTPTGGHIAVSAAREENQVVLRVRDDGIGIAPELLGAIFEPFVQGRRQDSEPSGLGLGLALVRNLVTLHGGSAQAFSDGPNCGAELVVRLPFAGAASETAAPRENAIPAVSAGARRRILLVDDNRDAAEMLSMLLVDAGHTVRIAHDPATALSLAPEMAAEVALLDIGLPVMDGYQLGNELRRQLGMRTPALVALTGYGQEQDRRRTADAGFAAHLVKPIDPQHLLDVIDGLVPPPAPAEED
jgi:PAS domain S-box-containing protein